MPIFKRQKGDISYYSTKAVDADNDLKSKLALINKGVDLGVLTAAEAEDKRKALQEAPADAEEVTPSVASLEAITAAYGLLAPIVRELRGAQIEMTVALLAEDKLDLTQTELRRLTGETPKKVREWCDEPAISGFGAKKSGKVREGFPTSVLRKLDEVVAEVAANAPSNRKKQNAA